MHPVQTLGPSYHLTWVKQVGRAPLTVPNQEGVCRKSFNSKHTPHSPLTNLPFLVNNSSSLLVTCFLNTH